MECPQLTLWQTPMTRPTRWVRWVWAYCLHIYIPGIIVVDERVKDRKRVAWERYSNKSPVWHVGNHFIEVLKWQITGRLSKLAHKELSSCYFLVSAATWLHPAYSDTCCRGHIGLASIGLSDCAGLHHQQGVCRLTTGVGEGTPLGASHYSQMGHHSNRVGLHSLHCPPHRFRCTLDHGPFS